MVQETAQQGGVQACIQAAPDGRSPQRPLVRFRPAGLPADVGFSGGASENQPNCSVGPGQALLGAEGTNLSSRHKRLLYSSNNNNNNNNCYGARSKEKDQIKWC